MHWNTPTVLQSLLGCITASLLTTAYYCILLLTTAYYCILLHTTYCILHTTAYYILRTYIPTLQLFPHTHTTVISSHLHYSYFLTPTLQLFPHTYTTVISSHLHYSYFLIPTLQLFPHTYTTVISSISLQQLNSSQKVVLPKAHRSFLGSWW